MKRIATFTLALMLLVLTACGGATNHIGKTYKTYWFSFKVTSAKTIDSYPGLEVADGYKLVDVEIQTTNTSGSELEMYDTDYCIVWGDGDYDWEECYVAVDDSMAPDTVVLADKEGMQYHYIYQVPEETTNPSIYFLEMFEGGEYGDPYFAYIVID